MPIGVVAAAATTSPCRLGPQMKVRSSYAPASAPYQYSSTLPCLALHRNTDRHNSLGSDWRSSAEHEASRNPLFPERSGAVQPGLGNEGRCWTGSYRRWLSALS